MVNTVIDAERKYNLFQRNPKKTIILTVIFLLLLIDHLAGAFFAVRLFSVGPGKPHSYYHHGLKKNYIGIELWGSLRPKIKTNSLGFKDTTNRKIALTTEKNRIIVIGDSFTVGLGYPNEETFVGLFENKLDRSKYEVLNAGVASYSPKLYYLRIKYLLEEVGLKFNELFVYIDRSDIVNEITYENFQPRKSLLLNLYIQMDSYFKHHSILYLIMRKKFKSELEKVLMRNGKEMNFANNKYDGNRSKVFKKQGFLLASRNMDHLYDLCKKNKIKMTIAIYPWPKELLFINNTLTKKEFAYFPDFWKKYARDKNIDIIDHFPLFINKGKADDVVKRYFIEEDIHWNSEGHKLVADTLYEYFYDTSLKH